jgi:uncharacterized protein YbjT (DUF2867 family)
VASVRAGTGGPVADGKTLVAGATGYIGRLLSRDLVVGGRQVRGLARTPEKASELCDAGVELVRGDLLQPETLPAALDGVAVAYYLVHSMGRGGGAGFAERDKRAARNFGAAAAEAGVERIVYLGGLNDGGSEHLRSRHETATVLREAGVPVTYLRAAAVVGSGSESFRTVLYLTKRLPVMVTPRWVSTRTQPIAIDDVLEYLAGAGTILGARGREIELGGPDVTTYGGMIDECARALGRRPPIKLAVPVLTPALSALWVGLITPVDTGVARPLIEGMESETVVTDDTGMELFDVERTPLAEAMRSAVAEGA